MQRAARHKALEEGIMRLGGVHTPIRQVLAKVALALGVSERLSRTPPFSDEGLRQRAWQEARD